jgi:hypothetical protein
MEEQLSAYIAVGTNAGPFDAGERIVPERIIITEAADVGLWAPQVQLTIIDGDFVISDTCLPPIISQ